MMRWKRGRKPIWTATRAAEKTGVVPGAPSPARAGAAAGVAAASPTATTGDGTSVAKTLSPCNVTAPVTSERSTSSSSIRPTSALSACVTATRRTIVGSATRIAITIASSASRIRLRRDARTRFQAAIVSHSYMTRRIAAAARGAAAQPSRSVEDAVLCRSAMAAGTAWDYAALKRMLAGERLPAMIVDLDVFDANVRRLVAIARAHGKTLRPASKSLRVPDLLTRVFEIGGAD